jgi:hypothetical protein
MLNLERILNQDRLIRAITGLNRKAFEELLPSFAEVYEQSLVGHALNLWKWKIMVINVGVRVPQWY